MRRSRTTLWLLLASLAGSFFAVRGVADPNCSRCAHSQRVSGHAISTLDAGRCSVWVQLNGPIAPLVPEAIVHHTESDRRVDEPNSESNDHDDDDTALARLSGDGRGDVDSAVDAAELALAVSRLAGPRPACIVSELDSVDWGSTERSTSVAPATIRSCLAIVERCIACRQTAVLATVRAARQSAGQAIGVGLISMMTPDRTARL